MKIRDLQKEIEQTLLVETPPFWYESMRTPLWKLAEKMRLVICRRLAFILNPATFDEWQKAHNGYGRKYTKQFWAVVNNSVRYEKAYESLEDDESRDIFRWRMKVCLITPFVMDWSRFFPAPPPPCVDGIEVEEEVKQFCYGFKNGHYLIKGICIPEVDDVVLDLGAYVGDSAVVFSRLVGENGHVWSFEALAPHYEKLKANVKRFQCENVTPCFGAAWNKNEELSINDQDGASCIGQGDYKVAGVRIDDFVRDNGIGKVDFIKMDIEGAEQEALQGASDTIRRFRPKLALSAYHKPEDMYRLMEIVRELDDGYRFYFRHHDSNFCETVLYAVS